MGYYGVMGDRQSLCDGKVLKPSHRVVCTCNSFLYCRISSRLGQTTVGRGFLSGTEKERLFPAALPSLSGTEKKKKPHLLMMCASPCTHEPTAGGSVCALSE
jgi:hypothetical protein